MLLFISIDLIQPCFGYGVEMTSVRYLFYDLFLSGLKSALQNLYYQSSEIFNDLIRLIAAPTSYLRGSDRVPG